MLHIANYTVDNNNRKNGFNYRYNKERTVKYG